MNELHHHSHLAQSQSHDQQLSTIYTTAYCSFNHFNYVNNMSQDLTLYVQCVESHCHALRCVTNRTQTRPAVAHKHTHLHKSSLSHTLAHI
jgi:hypothetical protein